MQEQYLATPKEPGRKPWGAWNIIERKGLEKAIWSRVGCAWKNQDGSFSIVLDSIPIGGRVHIREERPEDAQRPNQPRGQLSTMADRAEA